MAAMPCWARLSWFFMASCRLRLHIRGFIDPMGNDIDLSYTPPLCSPYDPIQMSGREWTWKSLLRE
jgi:hypothetical protein